LRVCGSAGTLILGEHTYKDLAEMHAAGVTVDMVDVFQRADRVRVLERVEREHTHTQRERERERDVRKCTHAHSLTRAASLYRMHLPLTHACTHTHTHTHTHRWDQSPTMPSRSAPRSCGCSSPCVTQVSFVSVIGLFCLCTTSLWPLY
jgi:hypothetical protein